MNISATYKIVNPVWEYCAQMKRDYSEKGIYRVSKECVGKPICDTIKEVIQQIFPFFDEHAANLAKWGFGAYFAALPVTILTAISPAQYAVFVVSARALYILREISFKQVEEDKLANDRGMSIRFGTIIGLMGISLYNLTFSQIILASLVGLAGKSIFDQMEKPSQPFDGHIIASNKEHDDKNENDEELFNDKENDGVDLVIEEVRYFQDDKKDSGFD
jgi:hypothetical protein